MSASQELRDAALSAPEQCFTAECLLKAAAEATHTAQRFVDDDQELAIDLNRSAQHNRELAKRVLARITPDSGSRDAVFLELIHRTRV